MSNCRAIELECMNAPLLAKRCATKTYKNKLQNGRYKSISERVCSMSYAGQKCHRHRDRCHGQGPSLLKVSSLLFICNINHGQHTDQRQYHKSHPYIETIMRSRSVTIDGRIGGWRRAAGPRRRGGRCGFFSRHDRNVIGRIYAN